MALTKVTIATVPPLLALTCTATGAGGGVTYQWYDNGVAIASATNSTLSYIPLSEGHHVITCIATDTNALTSNGIEIDIQVRY